MSSGESSDTVVFKDWLRHEAHSFYVAADLINSGYDDTHPRVYLERLLRSYAVLCDALSQQPNVTILETSDENKVD